MGIILNVERFKEIRLQLAWSQEQLAQVSGVSARTIQRIEQGGTASLETIKALAAGMGVSTSALLKPIGCLTESNPNALVKRITPLTVLEDMWPTLHQYLELGFTCIETGDPACVGLNAGSTYLILVTSEFMAADFRLETVAPLIGQTLPYIYVRSIAEAKEKLSPTSEVVEQVATRAGTIEALVTQGGQRMILAATT